MAKKKKDYDSRPGIWNSIRDGLGAVANVGAGALVGNVRAAATDAMEEAQKRVEESTHKVLKSTTVFLIMIFGIILAIVGLGKYLSETVPSLAHGLGYIVIGGCLLGLGLLIQFFRK